MLELYVDDEGFVVQLFWYLLEASLYLFTDSVVK